MPLSKKGRKVMASMKKQYGEEKGERVFYASANKGRIKGVHKGKKMSNPHEPYGDNAAKASSGSTPIYSASHKLGKLS